MLSKSLWWSAAVFSLSLTVLRLPVLSVTYVLSTTSAERRTQTVVLDRFTQPVRVRW